MDQALSPATGRRERLVLPGGDCVSLSLEPGDRLTVIDTEGRQPATIFFLGRDGSDAAGSVGWPLSPAPSPTPPPMPDADKAQILERLSLPNDALARVNAHRLFAGGEPAGSVVELHATMPLRVIIASGGSAMAPDEQSPPTDLDVTIERMHTMASEPPPPLARVTQEIRVPAAEARVYRVSAGDYIQIIDIDGKQCSDFVAFDADALTRGEEFGLDPTTTRTLMGSAFPGPGLHSKYFDARQTPLVEVVRDMVGRHDTFALACTAKYYADAGYPGHPSCSENFNRVLGPFGIRARAGWPAINFFYNTHVDEANLLVFDEPWSRPGDYVLLRALTDLVCASSSCADDIDPANGWSPTDIQVRVYDAAENFSKGIAFRMTQDALPRLTRETAFHPRTAQHTRNFVDYRGFWLPSCYTNAGPIEEYWACRERAAVMDLSPLRKFEVVGPDAELLMQRTLTRDVRKLAVGQVVYTALCYDHGGMIDDATLFRLGPANFRLICGEDYTGVWLRTKAAEWGLKVWVKSSTDQLHNIALQGPLSRGILAEALWTPATQPAVNELKWFRFTIARLGGPQGRPLVVSRTGYTGEVGYEIWCHPSDAVAVWDRIWAIGEPQGLRPLGLTALDTLRIEAGLAFAGYEFCDQTDPFEAGIGFTVAAKEEPFVGSEALARRKANPARKLCGLIIESNDAVSHGDPIYVGRAQVGVITSATKSPILKQNIALARLDVAVIDQPGLEIGKLDGHQKRLAARQVRFPHFDPEKLRVRG
jgi:aminomethyltransferase